MLPVMARSFTRSGKGAELTPRVLHVRTTYRASRGRSGEYSGRDEFGACVLVSRGWPLACGSSASRRVALRLCGSRDGRRHGRHQRCAGGGGGAVALIAAVGRPGPLRSPGGSAQSAPPPDGGPAAAGEAAPPREALIGRGAGKGLCGPSRAGGRGTRRAPLCRGCYEKRSVPRDCPPCRSPASSAAQGTAARHVPPGGSRCGGASAALCGDCGGCFTRCVGTFICCRFVFSL